VLLAFDAAQQVLQRELDPRQANAIVRFVSERFVLQVLVRGLFRDTPHVAKDMRQERAIGVLAQGFYADRDARQFQVVLFNREGSQAVHLARDTHRLVWTDRTQAENGLNTQFLVLAGLSLRRVKGRDADQGSHALEHGAALIHVFWKAGGHNAHGETGHVRYQLLAHAVIQDTARGGYGEQAVLVLIGRLLILVRGHDLQVPQRERDSDKRYRDGDLVDHKPYPARLRTHPIHSTRRGPLRRQISAAKLYTTNMASVFTSTRGAATCHIIEPQSRA